MSGQSAEAIAVPPFDDAYSATVKKLEAGETDIDYQAFRFSFPESEQFRIASKKSQEFKELEKQMYSLMPGNDYPEIVRTTQKMLSIDYTSMIAHKILRQTYAVMGEETLAAKYKTIQFGLLNSIVRNGDGRSCATAWPVIQVEEEYFILRMLDAKLIEQSVVHEDGTCDKMVVKEDGKRKTYYFGTEKVFEGYRKLLGK
jgi:hypothetical protein